MFRGETRLAVATMRALVMDEDQTNTTKPAIGTAGGRLWTRLATGTAKLRRAATQACVLLAACRSGQQTAPLPPSNQSPTQDTEAGIQLAFDAGARHTCALYGSGEVWCWGDNDYGQLGDGTLAGAREPVRVKGIPPAVAIACGQAHSCAVANDGSVWCWGSNDAGQSGDGNAGRQPSPARIDGVEDAVAVALQDQEPLTEHGTTSCALVQSGSIRCWGAQGPLRVFDPPAPLAQLSHVGELCGLDLCGAAHCTRFWVPSTRGWDKLGEGLRDLSCWDSICIGISTDDQLRGWYDGKPTPLEVRSGDELRPFDSPVGRLAGKCAILASGQVQCVAETFDEQSRISGLHLIPQYDGRPVRGAARTASGICIAPKSGGLECIGTHPPGLPPEFSEINPDGRRHSYETLQKIPQDVAERLFRAAGPPPPPFEPKPPNQCTYKRDEPPNQDDDVWGGMTSGQRDVRKPETNGATQPRRQSRALP